MAGIDGITSGLATSTDGAPVSVSDGIHNVVTTVTKTSPALMNYLLTGVAIAGVVYATRKGGDAIHAREPTHLTVPVDGSNEEVKVGDAAGMIFDKLRALSASHPEKAKEIGKKFAQEIFNIGHTSDKHADWRKHDIVYVFDYTDENGVVNSNKQIYARYDDNGLGKGESGFKFYIANKDGPAFKNGKEEKRLDDQTTNTDPSAKGDEKIDLSRLHLRTISYTRSGAVQDGHFLGLPTGQAAALFMGSKGKHLPSSMAADKDGERTAYEGQLAEAIKTALTQINGLTRGLTREEHATVAVKGSTLNLDALIVAADKAWTDKNKGVSGADAKWDVASKIKLVGMNGKDGTLGELFGGETGEFDRYATALAKGENEASNFFFNPNVTNNFKFLDVKKTNPLEVLGSGSKVQPMLDAADAYVKAKAAYVKELDNYSALKTFLTKVLGANALNDFDGMADTLRILQRRGDTFPSAANVKDAMVWKINNDYVKERDQFIEKAKAKGWIKTYYTQEADPHHPGKKIRVKHYATADKNGNPVFANPQAKQDFQNLRNSRDNALKNPLLTGSRTGINDVIKDLAGFHSNTTLGEAYTGTRQKYYAAWDAARIEFAQKIAHTTYDNGQADRATLNAAATALGIPQGDASKTYDLTATLAPATEANLRAIAGVQINGKPLVTLPAVDPTITDPKHATDPAYLASLRTPLITAIQNLEKVEGQKGLQEALTAISAQGLTLQVPAPPPEPAPTPVVTVETKKGSELTLDALAVLNLQKDDTLTATVNVRIDRPTGTVSAALQAAYDKLGAEQTDAAGTFKLRPADITATFGADGKFTLTETGTPPTDLPKLAPQTIDSTQFIGFAGQSPDAAFTIHRAATPTPAPAALTELTADQVTTLFNKLKDNLGGKIDITQNGNTDSYTFDMLGGIYKGDSTANLTADERTALVNTIIAAYKADPSNIVAKDLCDQPIDLKTLLGVTDAEAPTTRAARGDLAATTASAASAPTIIAKDAPDAKKDEAAAKLKDGDTVTFDAPLDSIGTGRVASSKVTAVIKNDGSVYIQHNYKVNDRPMVSKIQSGNIGQLKELMHQATTDIKVQPAAAANPEQNKPPLTGERLFDAFINTDSKTTAPHKIQLQYGKHEPTVQRNADNTFTISEHGKDKIVPLNGLELAIGKALLDAQGHNLSVKQNKHDTPMPVGTELVSRMIEAAQKATPPATAAPTASAAPASTAASPKTGDEALALFLANPGTTQLRVLYKDPNTDHDAHKPTFRADPNVKGGFIGSEKGKETHYADRAALEKALGTMLSNAQGSVSVSIDPKHKDYQELDTGLNTLLGKAAGVNTADPVSAPVITDLISTGFKSLNATAITPPADRDGWDKYLDDLTVGTIILHTQPATSTGKSDVVALFKKGNDDYQIVINPAINSDGSLLINDFLKDDNTQPKDSTVTELLNQSKVATASIYLLPTGYSYPAVAEKHAATDFGSISLEKFPQGQRLLYTSLVPFAGGHYERYAAEAKGGGNFKIINQDGEAVKKTGGSDVYTAAEIREKIEQALKDPTAASLGFAIEKANNDAPLENFSVRGTQFTKIVAVATPTVDGKIFTGPANNLVDPNNGGYLNQISRKYNWAVVGGDYGTSSSGGGVGMGVSKITVNPPGGHKVG